ncbi:MAG: hypothetical protein DIU70_008450 [Bacillota bacterium]
MAPRARILFSLPSPPRPPAGPGTPGRAEPFPPGQADLRPTAQADPLPPGRADSRPTAQADPLPPGRPAPALPPPGAPAPGAGPAAGCEADPRPPLAAVAAEHRRLQQEWQAWLARNQEEWGRQQAEARRRVEAQLKALARLLQPPGPSAPGPG